MPEGDSIRKMADALRPYLVGKAVREAWLREEDHYRRGPRNRPLVRVPALETVAGEVESVGKHLLLTLGDQVVRVHLGMDGDWHRYAPGERWRKRPERAWVVLETDADVVVCFDPQTVERLPIANTSEALARLGPDLLGDDIDWEAVLSGANAAPEDDGSIGTLLLDQTVAAGIGNVYRSEVLFMERVHPATPRGDLDDDALLGLYRRARDLLRANVGPGRRRTVRIRTVGSTSDRPDYWVYRRAGRPCLVCGNRVQARRQGVHARTVYWCPTCQPAG